MEDVILQEWLKNVIWIKFRSALAKFHLIVKLWCVLDVAFILKIDTLIIVWQNGARSYLHSQQFFSLR